MYYPIIITKEEGYVLIESPSFSDCTGTAKTYDQALINFWNHLYDKLNHIIEKKYKIPKYYTDKEKIKHEAFDGFFRITPNVELKLKIYQIAKKNEIDLEQIFESTTVDMKLFFDTRHPNTIWDFEQILLKMDYDLHFKFMPKNTS